MESFLKLNNVKKAVKPIGTLLMIAGIVFIINRAAKLNLDPAHFLNLRTLIFFTAATLLYAFGVFILANCWRIILSFLAKEEPDKSHVNYIFIKSNLFKYLPGNIMHLAGRNLLGSELNIPQRALALATLFEIILMCAVSFILAFLTGWETLLGIMSERLPSYGTIIAAVLLAAGFLIAAIMLRKNLKEYLNLSALKTAIKSFAGYTAFFLILTLSFAFFLHLQLPDLHSPLKIASAVIISWLIGFVTVGAPGGIGVREAALLFTLGGIYGESAILYASVLQRFSMILGEVLLFAAIALKRKLKEGLRPT
jgi:hypothetical protein